MGREFALLNASFEPAATSRNFRRELDVPLAEFDVRAGHLPGFDVDAAVITGSGASVYDGQQWIEDLIDWTRRAHERGVPVLGVCFGCQVLAEALGGRVAGQDERELGYRTVRHAGTSQVFAGIPASFTAFVSHGDDVVSVPLGARVLARTDHALQAFRLDHAVGVLFHPEYDFETARRITDKRADQPQRAATPASQTLTHDNYRAAREATRVFDNFERIAGQYEGAGASTRTGADG